MQNLFICNKQKLTLERELLFVTTSWNGDFSMLFNEVQLLLHRDVEKNISITYSYLWFPIIHITFIDVKKILVFNVE